MTPLWMHRRWWYAAGLLLLSAVGAAPACFAGEHVPVTGIRGDAGRHFDSWLNGSNSGIAVLPAYAATFSAAVHAFGTSAFAAAEARMDGAVEHMQSALIRPVALVRDWVPRAWWACHHCHGMSVVLERELPPELTLPKDPTDTVAAAYVGCRSIAVERLSPERLTPEIWLALPDDRRAATFQLVVERQVIVAEPALREIFRWLVSGIDEEFFEWTYFWDSEISHDRVVDLLHFRPTLCIQFLDGTSLVAEIDETQGLVLIETGGRVGVYEWRAGLIPLLPGRNNAFLE